MSGAIRRIAVAAAVAAIAAPAFAGDLTFSSRDANPITNHAVGQPYWVLQAQCAGLFGSMSNYQASRGRAAEAEQAKAQGVAFMKDSLARLRVDRGLEGDNAMAAAGAQVNVGRAHAQQIIAMGTDDHSQWNVERSFCLDVNDAYHARRG